MMRKQCGGCLREFCTSRGVRVRERTHENSKLKVTPVKNCTSTSTQPVHVHMKSQQPDESVLSQQVIFVKC